MNLARGNWPATKPLQLRAIGASCNLILASRLLTTNWRSLHCGRVEPRTRSRPQYVR